MQSTISQWLRVAMGAALFAAGTASAAPLQPAEPAEVGLSAERLARLDAHLQNLIDDGAFPGAVTMVLRDGKIAHLSALGKRTEGGEPMTEDTIFRIYSMTKPVVSVAAMMLVEEGKLSISDPVSKYFPEYKDLVIATGKAADGTIKTVKAKRTMTVQDLLRHTSGLTYGFFGTGPARDALKASGAINGKNNARQIARILGNLPLEHEPGTTWEYSRSTDVLGAVIEVIEGKSLQEVLSERLFEPLGMKDTAFWVADATQHARIAEPLATDNKIGTNPMFDPRIKPVFESGGGGLVSTIHDYARFAQMLLNGGALDDVRILSPHTISYMTSDHLGEAIKPGKYYLPGAGYGFGLGFGVRRQAGVSPVMGSQGEYNWGGAGGTYYFADPQEKMVVIYMMQSPRYRVPLRTQLRSMVYGAFNQSIRVR